MNRQRNWLRLVVAHAGVAAASPLVGTVLFLLLAFNLQESFHFGGVLALGFGLLFAYLLFGAQTLIGVFLASPVLLVISKFQNRPAATCASLGVGAFFGWAFCSVFIAPQTDDDKTMSAMIAVAATAAIAAAILEAAWRKSWKSTPQ